MPLKDPPLVTLMFGSKRIKSSKQRQKSPLKSFYFSGFQPILQGSFDSANSSISTINLSQEQEFDEFKVFTALGAGGAKGAGDLPEMTTNPVEALDAITLLESKSIPLSNETFNNLLLKVDQDVPTNTDLAIAPIPDIVNSTVDTPSDNTPLEEPKVVEYENDQTQTQPENQDFSKQDYISEINFLNQELDHYKKLASSNYNQGFEENLDLNQKVKQLVMEIELLSLRNNELKHLVKIQEADFELFGKKISMLQQLVGYL